MSCGRNRVTRRRRLMDSPHHLKYIHFCKLTFTHCLGSWYCGLLRRLIWDTSHVYPCAVLFNFCQRLALFCPVCSVIFNSVQILGRGSFFLFQKLQTVCRAWPAPTLIGDRAFSVEVKRQWREATYSSPYSADVINAWNYTSTPSISLMTCKGTALLVPFIYL